MILSQSHLRCIVPALVLLGGCGGGATVSLPPAARSGAAANGDTAAAQRSIAASVANLQAAWNAGDAAAWSAQFAPDAHFVNILGVAIDGTAAIAALHARLFAGPFRGSTFAGTLRATRFPAPDVAIVDLDTAVTGFRALPPGATATAPGTLDTKFVFVYARLADAWRIVSAQNTAVAPVAATH